MGAVVLSYSMVGWNDSQQVDHDHPLVLALQTANSLRAVDFLIAQEDVDATRIGVTGASGGGTQAIYLAFLDDRIAAAAPLVIVYPWGCGNDGCNCETGMPVMQSTPTTIMELSGLIAPRPQLIVSCGLLRAGKPDPDPTHDFPATVQPLIESIYRDHAAADQLQCVHLTDEPHDFGPTKRAIVYEFFAKHFGLASVPEDLTRIAVEPAEALAAVNSLRPLPEAAAQDVQDLERRFKRWAGK